MWIQSISLTGGALDGHGSNQAHLLNVSFSLQHCFRADRALAVSLVYLAVDSAVEAGGIAVHGLRLLPQLFWVYQSTHL